MTSMSTSPVYTVSRARACTPYMSKLDMVDMVAGSRGSGITYFTYLTYREDRA